VEHLKRRTKTHKVTIQEPKIKYQIGRPTTSYQPHPNNFTNNQTTKTQEDNNNCSAPYTKRPLKFTHTCNPMHPTNLQAPNKQNPEQQQESSEQR